MRSRHRWLVSVPKLSLRAGSNLKKIFWFFCATLLIVTTQLLFADVTATKELTQLMKNIHTMQATFVQSLVNQHGTRVGAKTSGRVVLKRPGKFRWEITQPSDQVIVINKDKMLSYDPDLSQLTRRKVNIKQPGNPAMLLSSPIEILQQSFHIVKLKQTGKESWFKLTPKKQKNQENSYQWLNIGFVQDKLSAMYIFDSFEQTSLISFKNAIFNAEISDKKFTFTPPPNTEVFDAD